MKDDDAMTIRQMCDTFDVTARTLRFYEAKDLLSPIREGQKRLFTIRDRARLKLILRAKRFGLSLEEARHLLDLYNIGDKGHTQLARSYEQACERLAAMELQHEELGEAIADLKKHMQWGAERLTTLSAQAAE
ncbi:MAG: MerR family DNA-binding transcriptional regulator [Marinosulfonomonas sp.]|nr:MerR family DNA-binding transcriptional regulator [Marinosulfonomonas sp.]